MQRHSVLWAIAFLGGWIFACVDGEGTSATPCIDDSQCPLTYQCVTNYCIPDSAASLGGDGDGDSATSDFETGDPETGDPETGGPGDGDPGDGDPGDGDPGDGDGEPCTPGTVGCSCDAGVCAPSLVCNEDYLCVPGDCGDGVVMDNEECEAGDLQGLNCYDLGFEGGQLGCDPDTCQYDTSQCSLGGCGNGIIDVGEQCDGNNLNGFTCVDLGYSWGDLACDPVVCTYDASACIADSDAGGTG